MKNSDAEEEKCFVEEFANVRGLILFPFIALHHVRLVERLVGLLHIT